MSRPDRSRVLMAGRVVTVERRPISGRPANGRRWSRGEVHEMGTAAVALALSPVGGALDGADRRRLLGGSKASDGGKRDIGCAAAEATGRLAADVTRLLAHGPLRFPGEMVSDAAGVR